MQTTFEQLGKQVTIEGSAHDHIFRTIQTSGDFYEREMLDYMASLNPTGSVVDVGANIGNHSVYLGLFTNSPRIIAIEPYLKASEYLKGNIATNKLGDIVVQEHCALGAANSRVGLKPGPARNIGHTKVREGSDIALRPLDEVVMHDKVSIIKVDVEGYELEVLKGAAETLARQKPYLFVEASNKLRRRKLDAFLAQFGYQRDRVFNNQPTYLYSSFVRTGATSTR